MSKTNFVRVYRLLGAALIVSAAIYTVVVQWDESGFTLGNFFSYFTILSNLWAAAVLAAGGLMAGRRLSERFEMLHGAAVLYMAMTGLVYAVALSGVDVNTPNYPNWVLHRIMPVVMVLDWLFEPPRVPLTFRRTLLWLIFPLLYLPYTLIRGEIVDWYPYPFLDPTRDGGYARVFGASLIVAVGFIAGTWLVTWSANHFRPHSAPAQ